MSDFRILDAPIASMDSQYLGSFFVVAQRMNPNIAAFLGIDGTIVGLGGYNYDYLYFDTENDAHNAAHKYYEQHGEHYPHIAKWIECMPQHGVVTAPQTTESQIMEFE